MSGDAAGFWILFGSTVGVLTIVVIGLLVYINLIDRE